MFKIIRNIVLVLLTAAGVGQAAAQSADERIATAMNNADWFGLNDIYNSTPQDSINPFLEVFSRCLIGNRLNRPDVSVPAFRELLSSHSESLGLPNLLSSAYMYARDLSRTADNTAAASILRSVADAVRPHVDAAVDAQLLNMAQLYEALSEYKPYSVSIAGGAEGSIPFSFREVGNKSKGGILMYLDSTTVNGFPADIVFDTGAGMNIISDSLAQAYGLTILDADASISGVGKANGKYAIAHKLSMGNVTVGDVPFIVADISTNNAEADKHINALEIIVGSDLMLALKDITVDFIARHIAIQADTSARSDDSPNMCFSSTENLITTGKIAGQPMTMCIDTGAGGYGWLSADYFEKNKAFITDNCSPDTVRHAGIGGVSIQQCYNMHDATMSLSGANVTIPEIAIFTESLPALAYEAVVGLKSLMLYRAIRFNLVDMKLTTVPYPDATTATRPMPKFEYSPAPKPNTLQIIGHVLLEAAREHARWH